MAALTMILFGGIFIWAMINNGFQTNAYIKADFKGDDTAKNLSLSGIILNWIIMTLLFGYLVYKIYEKDVNLFP